MSSPLPRTLDRGRYEIVSRLGEGSSSQVYVVHDRTDDRRYAAKILDTVGPQRDIARAMFQREQAALDGFEHPAVVRLERWFGDEDRLVLILELVSDGRTLTDVLDDVAARRRDRPAVQWRVAQALALVEALLAAHARNVIHRDIKPGNLLFSRGEETLKLADFGIALVLEIAAAAPAGTTLREFHTLPYAPPEQLLQQDVSFPADVHALGLVLACLFALTLPDDDFRATGVEALLDAAAPDFEAAGCLPEDWRPLRDVLVRCLATDPRARPRLQELQPLLRAVADRVAPPVTACLAFTRAARDKLRAAGFADEAELLADLNDGLRVGIMDDATSATPRIECLGRHAFVVVVADRTDAPLTVIDAGRGKALGHDTARRRSAPCRIVLREGRGDAGALVRFAEETVSIVHSAETAQLLETAEQVVKLELERLAKLRVHYVLHDGESDARSSDIDRARAAGLTATWDDCVTLKGTVRLEVGRVVPWSPPRNKPTVRQSVDAQLGTRTAAFDDADAMQPLEGWHELYEDPTKVTVGLPTANDRIEEIGSFAWFDEATGELTIELRKKTRLPRIGALQLRDKQAEVVLKRQRDALNKLRTGETVRRDLPLLLARTGAHRMGERVLCSPLQPELARSPQVADLVERILAAEGIFTLQGPPGTGKTTLITEVVAQALMLHPEWRIGVVAQANEAVANVFERLRDTRAALSAPWMLCRDVRDELAKEENEAERRRLAARGSIAPEDSQVSGRRHAFRAFAQRTAAASERAERAHADLPPGAAAALAQWREALRAGARGTQREFAELVQVWGVTLVRSAGVLANLERQELDLLVVDEAAKASVAETLVPMVASRRFLLVGDHKQLPPYLDTLTSDQLRQLQRDPARARFSLFEHLRAIVPRESRDMLRTQFRMHRSIGDFVSQLFYAEEGGVRTGVADDARDLAPGLFRRDHRVFHVHVEGAEEAVGTSKRNRRELDVMVRILRRLDDDAAAAGARYEVAVMSAYKPQVRQLDRRLRGLKWRALDVKAATVDSFQGRQADVVVYSTVRTSASEWQFVGDERRLNVALSRAKRLLVLVGHRQNARNTPILQRALGLVPAGNCLEEGSL